jgi:electron transport complex protein RnfG
MKIRNLLLTAAVVTTAAVAMTSGGSADDVMTRSADGTYVVNTTTLAPTVKGYAGATPLKIHIKNDRIVKIEALPNRESHNVFLRAEKGLFGKWTGKQVGKASKQKVDAVSGATYSSNAIKENVKRGLAYYRKHKK